MIIIIISVAHNFICIFSQKIFVNLLRMCILLTRESLCVLHSLGIFLCLVLYKKKFENQSLRCVHIFHSKLKSHSVLSKTSSFIHWWLEGFFFQIFWYFLHSYHRFQSMYIVLSQIRHIYLAHQMMKWTQGK